MRPWQCWHHCTAHTYGTWLPGDPRGWRARNHREHVNGDYKNPPPKDAYANRYTSAKSLMKREPLKVPKELLQSILNDVVQCLYERNDEVQIGCFDGSHMHVLVQCWNLKPRIELGAAKQFATAQLKARGSAAGLHLNPGEGIWSKGSHITPISNSAHFFQSMQYIANHAQYGAALWQPRAIPEIEAFDLRLDQWEPR